MISVIGFGFGRVENKDLAAIGAGDLIALVDREKNAGVSQLAGAAIAGHCLAVDFDVFDHLVHRPPRL